MQFVAPAQIFLVLWLLAATAPAATALVNGSLAALIDAQSKDLQLSPPGVDGCPEEAAESNAFAFIDAVHTADVTALIFLALSESECLLPLAVGEDTICYCAGEPPIALSLSLLHTTVQRHRPKAA